MVRIRRIFLGEFTGGWRLLLATSEFSETYTVPLHSWAIADDRDYQSRVVGVYLDRDGVSIRTTADQQGPILLAYLAPGKRVTKRATMDLLNAARARLSESAPLDARFLTEASIEKWATAFAQELRGLGLSQRTYDNIRRRLVYRLSSGVVPDEMFIAEKIQYAGRDRPVHLRTFEEWRAYVADPGNAATIRATLGKPAARELFGVIPIVTAQP